MERRATKKNVENEKATKGDWNGWVSFFIYCFICRSLCQLFFPLNFTPGRNSFLLIYIRIPFRFNRHLCYDRYLHADVVLVSCCEAQQKYHHTKDENVHAWISHSWIKLNLIRVVRAAMKSSRNDDILFQIPQVIVAYIWIWLNNQHCPLEKVQWMDVIRN